jgi:hypothetical protein
MCLRGLRTVFLAGVVAPFKKQIVNQHRASRLLIIEVVKFALLQGFGCEAATSFESVRTRLRTFIVVADLWNKGGLMVFKWYGN